MSPYSSLPTSNIFHLIRHHIGRLTCANQPDTPGGCFPPIRYTLFAVPLFEHRWRYVAVLLLQEQPGERRFARANLGVEVVQRRCQPRFSLHPQLGKRIQAQSLLLVRKRQNSVQEL